MNISQSTVHKRLHEQKHKGFARSLIALITKCTEKNLMNSGIVLWTEETNMIFYRCNGNCKVSANDPKHTCSSVKHSEGGVMACTCIAFSERLNNVHWICNALGQTIINSMSTETFCLSLEKKMHPNTLWDFSSCSYIMTQNTKKVVLAVHSTSSPFYLLKLDVIVTSHMLS